MKRISAHVLYRHAYSPRRGNKSTPKSVLVDFSLCMLTVDCLGKGAVGQGTRGWGRLGDTELLLVRTTVIISDLVVVAFVPSGCRDDSTIVSAAAAILFCSVWYSCEKQILF